MIRDVTGLNEASDASTPDAKSLVGVQKMAAANSNTATRHILKGGMYLTQEVAEALSLRISDIIEYSPTKDAFIQQIGAHNVATLKEMKNLHLYDFGIFLELEPDVEEKQLLENNIQAALGADGINLEDAIDLRSTRNVKLANQLLKVRRKRKDEADKASQLAQTEAQGKAQADATNATVGAEKQKQDNLVETQIRLEGAKNTNKAQTLELEARLKKELMDHEFELNKQLQQLETETVMAKDKIKEDRKDERVGLQASHQEKLIEKREQVKQGQDLMQEPNPFETISGDVMDNEIGLGEFGLK
mgnify:FL=1